MATIQKFGVKYPFTNEGFQNYFIDLNDTMKDKVRSQLMYVTFTQKGSVLRNPEFGTDLIKYIFEPNEVTSWESVKQEISNSVSRWIPNLTLRDLQVMNSENGDEHEILVRLDYSVTQGNKTMNDSIITKV